MRKLTEGRMCNCLMRRAVWIVLSTALLFVAICGFEFVRDTIRGRAENVAFQRVVRDADRVVVRDGGFGCCCDVDKATVYYVITNKSEIVAFNRMFRFRGKGEGCKCCGDFGIDWWRGADRIALMAVHHGETLQWRGFDNGYALLSRCSAREILDWFNGHRSMEGQNR